MRAVRRLERHEDLVRLLADDPHPEAGRSIFPTMRDLMCFAAVLGFQEERRMPLDGKTQEIDARIWRADELATDLLFLIPLAATRSLALAQPDSEDELVSIFEEYANGGLEILEEWFRETPDDTRGDRALINGLQKRGYLAAPKAVDAVIHQISF